MSYVGNEIFSSNVYNGLPENSMVDELLPENCVLVNDELTVQGIDCWTGVDECGELNEIQPESDECVYGVDECGGLSEIQPESIECLTVVDECGGRNEIQIENSVGLNDEVAVKGGECVPQVGKKFASDDEAFDYYLEYARKVGFPIRRRNSRKGPDGLMRSVTFVCSREGKRSSTARNSLKPHPTMQIGCKAKMTACSDALGTWRVTVVHLDHNHSISPSRSRIFRCNRRLTDNAKRKLEVNDIAGIPLHKSFNSAVVEAGGYDHLSYTEKDCRNYVARVRRLRLGEGDAVAIQAYFSKMQANCPGFFFNVDLDEESRLRNIFWADNRCRHAYKEFGDVITFDTTYLTNKYDMPFAPFVGVNHHGQSTLLGCGLVSSEDTETFVWLFKTWLECMHGQAPGGIITDQDRAMQNAISIVFPNAKHRWCLWHILKKLPEKFGGHTQKGAILAAVHEVVYDSQTPEEFDRCWNEMIDMYGLCNNDWLSGLYRERARWVPSYLRTSFWAGMSTTQRSESINAFFDGYVHSKTTLKQFVEQYERALRSKVEKEFQADVKSHTQMVPCVTTYAMEKQIQQVYTINKFKEFQMEITGKVYCDLVSAGDGGRFEVEEDVTINGFERRKNFGVAFDREQEDVVCSCHLFEFKGIVCRHAISVLMRNGVKVLPERYILRRWRRDVRRSYTRVEINYDGWVSSAEQVRYNQLSNAFARLADEVVNDDIRTRQLLDWIENQLSHSSKVLESSVPNVPSIGDAVPNQLAPIFDPKVSKRKGAPRKNRQKGPLEKSSKKSKVACNTNKRKRKAEGNVDHNQPIIVMEGDQTFATTT